MRQGCAAHEKTHVGGFTVVLFFYGEARAMVELSLAPRTLVREDSERSEPRRQFLAREASFGRKKFD